MWSTQTIETATNNIHTAINAALDVRAPTVPFRPKRLSFTWWNPELDILKKATRAAHRTARKGDKCPVLWDQYRRIGRQFKYACQSARRKSWQAFTTEADKMHLAARLNKILRQKNHRTLGALKKPEGEFSDSSQESYLLLMAEHFPGAVPIGAVGYKP
jgi:hypothetical protein